MCPAPTWERRSCDARLPACVSLMQPMPAMQQVANPNRPCYLLPKGLTASAGTQAILVLMHPANQKVRTRSSAAVMCSNCLLCYILCYLTTAYPDLLCWRPDMVMTTPCVALPCLHSALLCALPHCCNKLASPCLCSAAISSVLNALSCHCPVQVTALSAMDCRDSQ